MSIDRHQGHAWSAAAALAPPPFAMPTARLELLGEGAGRILGRKHLRLGEMEATFCGDGVVSGERVADSGTLTYRGRPQLFRGDFRAVFTSAPGTTVAAVEGAHAGVHLRGGVAVLQSVGIFNMPPQPGGLGPEFALVEIEVRDLTVYRYRFFRLGSVLPHSTN